MTERDFDKIFQDKIGDELPFEFQPSDWLAAEQELDKVMPISAPIAPVSAVPRLLTWHKWAAAAAVLLLGSQLFLMSELRTVKQEVVSLHQENAALKASENQEIKTPIASQNTVIQYDTIVKTIVVEVPQRGATLEKELKARGVDKVDFDNFVANQNTINDRYEAGAVNKKRQNTEGSSKPNLSAKNNDNLVLNTGKMPLQLVENATKNTIKDNTSEALTQLVANDLVIKNKDLIGISKSLIELNEANKGLTITNDLKNQNDALINKNKNLISQNNQLIALNKDKAIINELIAKNEELIEINGQLIDFNKDKSVLTVLPMNTQLAAVKSINRNKNWLNDEAFDYIKMSKLPIIKPVSMPNGWEISANTLLLSNEDHRKSQKQPQRDNDKEKQFSAGANLRLGYNIRNNVRLSAEIDFWSECHAQDTGRRSPRFSLPPDFKLESVEQISRSWQVRLGADYKTRQFIGLQPFIGIGLVYQGRTNDEFQYSFKRGNIPLPAVNEPNDTKLTKPFAVGFRAGVEGKIYRRLSWSVDINAQRATTLSSHIGLKYAL